ncbi:hypothetical protein [Bacteroides faecium]|uniref:Uncharacterized protein n=1 Tax=Bacteroides faecium TaxID=2715212 RepID=A0A6H0KLW2_9BACE|nr:hypothetical protein [Bacteroides faecium]QIU93568.1 hypothetical protein BacF7301_05110 [Bacteroides faecium]
MKKRILFFIVMLFLLHVVLYAQDPEKTGAWVGDAIPVTFTAGQSTFTDTRNTTDYRLYDSYGYRSPFTGEVEWTEGGAVFYRLQTETNGDIIINNWGSDVAFSSLFLVTPIDPLKEPIDGLTCDLVRNVAMIYPWDYISVDPPSDFPGWISRGQAYLHVSDLPAGIYYIISAGYKGSNASKPDGNVRTNITLKLQRRIPDEPSVQPEEPNNSSVQYRYDLSGNRVKNIKKQ